MSLPIPRDPQLRGPLVSAARNDGCNPAALPEPQLVATLVTGVTRTMFGFAFRLVERPITDELAWKRGLICVTGSRPVGILMSSNRAGCTALASAMFSCPEGDVDASMMDDSLRELLNMTAGQINRALKLDEALSLPRIVDSPTAMATVAGWRRAALRSDRIELEAWLSNDPRDWVALTATGAP